MWVVAEPRADDVRSSHQFEEEIGAASSENGLLIAEMEFSVQTGHRKSSPDASWRAADRRIKQSPLNNAANRLCFYLGRRRGLAPERNVRGSSLRSSDRQSARNRIDCV